MKVYDISIITTRHKSHAHDSRNTRKESSFAMQYCVCQYEKTYTADA